MTRRAHHALTTLAIVLLVIPTVTLAVVSALILYARTDAGRERVRRIVLAQAHAALPGLEIGRIEGDYVRELRLEDVTIRDRQKRPAVHVDRIQARFSLVPLLHGRLWVRELDVDHPRILGRPTDRGTLNLTELTTPSRKPRTKPEPKASGGSGLAVQVDRLNVLGGRADVETPAGQTVVVDALDLQGALAMAGETTRAELAPLSIAALIDGRRYRVELRARGRLSDRELHAAVDALVVDGITSEGPITLHGEAGGPRSRIGFQVDCGLPRTGSLRAHGTVALTPAGLGAYLAEVAAARVDPRALVATAPAGALALTARVRGEGTPLAPGSRAALSLTMPPSRIAGLALREVRVEAGAEGDAWHIDRARVRGAGAQLDLRGHGRGPRVEARLRAAVGDPADGRLPAPDFHGRGQLTADLRGTPDALAFEARARGRKLAVGDVRIGALTLDARGTGDRKRQQLTLTARGQADAVAAAGARVGKVSLDAHVTGKLRTPRGTVHLAATTVQAPGEGPRLDKVVVDLQSDGRTLRVRGNAAGPGGHGGLEAGGWIRPREARVTLERFSIDVRSPRLTQSIALLEPVTVHWRADDLVELGALRLAARGDKLSGRFKVAGNLRLDRRRRTEPRAFLALSVRQAAVDGLDLVDADGWAKLWRRQLQAGLEGTMGPAKLRLSADIPVIPRRDGGLPRLARNGAMAVVLETSKVDLKKLPLLEKQLARRGLTGGVVSLQASVNGEVSHPDGKVAFDLAGVELRSPSGQGRDSVVRRIPGVGANLVIDTERGAIKARARTQLYGAGFVNADARLGADLGDLLAGADLREVPLRADVQIPRFQISALKGYFEQLRDSEGVLAGSVSLKGTVRRPSASGELTLGNARVDRLRFGPVVLRGTLAGDKVAADVKIDESQGGTLVAHVDVAAHGPLAASATARKLDITFLRLFTSGVRELGGVVDAQVQAAGSLAAPRLEGNVYYYGGRLGVVGQPTFRAVAVTLGLAPGRVDVSKVQAFSGDGALTGKGSVTLEGLSPTRVVLTAHAHRFMVAAAGSSGARLDGDFAVEAALSPAVLSGKVNVPQASLWLPKVGPGGKKLQKIGAHEDVRFVDEAARAADAKSRDEAEREATGPRKLDLRASAGTVFVRGKDLDIELESNLHVTSDGRGAPSLTGTVQIRRGRINITGQRFDFDPGQIAFAGGTTPNLNVRITHQYPEALVAVEIRGTPDKPQLRLSSDPPLYDQAQIVSLVLTGQPGGQPSTGGSFDPTSAIATAVLGKLADKIAPELGLDVLRVENVKEKTDEGTPTGETETRIEVGKYISERVYLSYAHVFGGTETQNRNEAHVEYRVTRHWLVETVFGDAGVGGVDALWTYRY